MAKDSVPELAQTINRHHFIRNAATAPGVAAVPAAAGARENDTSGASSESLTSEAAWQVFELRLVETLSDLSEDEHLVIVQKATKRFVQFAAQGHHGMRIEAVSNAFLPKNAQLSARAIDTLLSMGWHAPTYELAEGTAEPADGSPNFYLDTATPVPFGRLATLGVKTLRAAYRVRHPGELQYSAASSSDDTTDIRFPSLGLKRGK
jgi:hypothetical protein